MAKMRLTVHAKELQNNFLVILQLLRGIAQHGTAGALYQRFRIDGLQDDDLVPLQFCDACPNARALIETAFKTNSLSARSLSEAQWSAVPSNLPEMGIEMAFNMMSLLSRTAADACFRSREGNRHGS